MSEYHEEEFCLHHYNGGEAGHDLCIEHLPSGLRTRVVYATSGLSQVQDRLLQELIVELKAQGIAPQPPKIGIKKLGKSRWV